MGAYGNMDQALPGMLAQLDADFESAVAGQDIDFGRPVVGYPGEEGKCYPAVTDQITSTGSVDLVTANSTVVTVTSPSLPGGSKAVAAVVFATSHAATITAIIAAINADTVLAAAGIFAIAGGARDIVVRSRGAHLTSVVPVTTLGAGQPTWTPVNATWGKFLGVAYLQHMGGKVNASGAAKWMAKDVVSVVSRGQVWVPVSVNVQDKEAAYFQWSAGANQGQFTNVSSGNGDIKSFFRSNRNAQNLAIVEVRGMQ